MPVSQGFIFTRSVNPKSRHDPTTDHKALSRFGAVHLYAKRRRGRGYSHTEQSDFAFSDFLAVCRRSFLACMLVNSICCVEFNVLVTSGDCWNFGSSRPYIKALGQSELPRVEQRRGRENSKCCDKIPEWRCLFKWCHVSGTYRHHSGRAVFSVWVGGTTTPQRSLKRSKIGENRNSCSDNFWSV